MADTTTIRRIPTGADVSAPGSLRPSGNNPGIDYSGLNSGEDALVQGLGQLGGSLERMGEAEQNKQRTADVAAADAAWLVKSHDLTSAYQARGDYQNFDKSIGNDTTKALDEAAALIRDPEARTNWLQASERNRLGIVFAVQDHATELGQEADRVKLSTSVDKLAEIYADPTTPQVTRDAVQKSIAASIATAQGSGLVGPADAQKLKDVGITAAERQLALNRVKVDITIDPQGTLNALGIPSASDNGTGIVTAAAAANGGKLPDLDPSLAKVTADLLGDANFPTDPKQVRAYLSDPAMAAKYSAGAAAMLNTRYKGDLTAVAIALDPKGGTVLADRWVASNHSEAVLPPDVRDRYRQTMTNYAPAVSGDRIPLEAAPGVDLSNSDPAVLDRFEQLQSKFGQAVQIIPAHREGEHNAAVNGADASQHLDGRSLELDVSTLSKDRRVQLIEMASSMGFTGIGIYGDSLHLDTGPVVAWGPDGKPGSVPGWAKDAADAHAAGTVKDVPLLYAKVDPRYAALPFDTRLQLAGDARAAIKNQNVGMQASLETIANNAPAAIANTGTYDGDMPTATSFVQAYGATEGIQKFQEFQASVDTAKTMFGFRTEPADAIMAEVTAAMPKSSGNGAALEAKRFDMISAAADQTLKARTADPAGYVLNAYPAVADAFTAAQDGKDPAAFSHALTMMQTAQTELGIASPELLPKSMAAGAAAQFNDATQPADKRVGAIAGLVLRTSDEGQQKAIYNQLVASGVPEYTQGAVAAMVRGDTSGAQNLMRAVMIDPEKLAGQLPGNVKSTDIDGAIQSKIFDRGQIGDIIYGVSDGSADNFNRVRADSTLINRDVRLHLIDGSAGGNVDKAIDLTIKDMYGDVQPVTGGGIKITLPRGTDATPYRAGFSAILPRVGTALKQDMVDGMISVLGSQIDIRQTGMSDVVNRGIDNAAQVVLSEGYFTNAGPDKYQFVNPLTGAVVGDAKGNPLIFTKADVLAAGAGAPPANYYNAPAAIGHVR